MKDKILLFDVLPGNKNGGKPYMNLKVRSYLQCEDENVMKQLIINYENIYNTVVIRGCFLGALSLIL